MRKNERASRSSWIATALLPLAMLIAVGIWAQTETVDPGSADEPPAEEKAAAEESETTDEEAMVDSPSSDAPPVLMSDPWAVGACETWNQTTELTDGLGEWIQNDLDRGFKVIQLYRTDCPESGWVELRLAEEEGAVRCFYGGAKETAELDSSADYIMHAMTERWQQMGAGSYGPMWAMMTGRLKFKGPKFEAMRSMGPFKSFLLLVGEVESDVSTCP